jgi:uncharacterized membrane protein YraQ (UPF0718 family)
LNWTKEWKPLLALLLGILILFLFPLSALPDVEGRLLGATLEGLALAGEYAREHVLFCLVPAFFIAGAIAVFVRGEPVLRLLGPGANPLVSYGVASVAGTVLAVCSCTVLPIFAGIYAVGAGLGPATAFLYSGPAINVLAIILTARVLGAEIGLARALGAVTFAVVLGVLMQFAFRRDRDREIPRPTLASGTVGSRPLRQTGAVIFFLVGILVAANWGMPAEATGVWYRIFRAKWALTAILGAGLGLSLARWYGMSRIVFWGTAMGVALLALAFPRTPALPFVAGTLGLTIGLSRDRDGDLEEWLSESWGFTKQIVPLLFAGVLVAGFLLGRPGEEGLIPSVWILEAVGGNSPLANLSASVAGAFMYFATLTEVPILEGLLGNGMGKGPALALLLAGPAVSLPSLLVIRSVLGGKKTAVFTLLVVVMATTTGLIYGGFIG